MAPKRRRIMGNVDAAMGGYAAEVRTPPVRGAVDSGQAGDFRGQPQENYDALAGAQAAQAGTLRRRRRR